MVNFLYPAMQWGLTKPAMERLAVHGSGSSCHAGRSSFAIDMNGDVHLCQFMIDSQTLKAANIHGASPQKVWSLVQKARQDKLEGLKQGRCQGCGFFEPNCQGACLAMPGWLACPPEA
jgi:radical SAM protein with 4Fe4S-binding SPASM domain